MDSIPTKNYAFILGRERDLCLAELKAVLKRFCFDFVISSVADNVAFINFKSPADMREISRLQDVLGGTVKIFAQIHEINPFGQEGNSNLGSTVIDLVRQCKAEGKLDYGISSFSRKYNRIFVNNLGLSIKKKLKKELSLRFVALREGSELSSIQSLKNKLASEGIEIGLFENQIGILVGVSNADAWSERDYGKPAGDKRSGMLPPKLARIMVNLALGKITNCQLPTTIQIQNPDNQMSSCKIENFKLKINKQTLVIDPFCGSGNVALEALMLGCDLFASDLSTRAVEDTKANLQWLVSNYGLQMADYSVIQADAIDSSLIENLKKINNYDDAVIVSEPYLGEPKKFKPTLSAARGEYSKVKKLYLDFLSNFLQLTTYNLQLCIVFPLVETSEGKVYSLFRESVDEIRKMGYILLEQPLRYGRDYQVVKREIVLLRQNPSRN